MAAAEAMKIDTHSQSPEHGVGSWEGCRREGPGSHGTRDSLRTNPCSDLFRPPKTVTYPLPF